MTNPTKLQSLQRIKDAFEKGLLQERGACSYRDDSGKPCAIGLLLSDDQVERLKNESLNDEKISDVHEVISHDELFATTGMTSAECRNIQQVFDGGMGHTDAEFIKCLDAGMNPAAE